MITLPEAIKDDFKVITQTLTGMQQGKINPFPVADEPVFFSTNKVASDKIFTNNPTAVGQNNWNQYPI
jgi:hypothetical protein